MAFNGRLLFIAPLQNGSTSRLRYEAMLPLFDEVRGIDINEYLHFWKRGLISFQRRISFSPALCRLRRRVLTEVSNYQPTVIWIEKSTFLTTEAIKAIRSEVPGSKIIHFSPDDYFNPKNTSSDHVRSLSHFDWVVTNKLHNIDRLKAVTRARIAHCLSAGPDSVHELTLSSHHRYHISFIGQYEKERWDALSALASEYPVDIFGPDWPKPKITQLRVHKPVWGDECRETIRASKINLCFLRKVNSDTSTTRTFEIPSQGGLLVAERTSEHMTLFREGTEAFFFSNIVELKHICSSLLSISDQELIAIRRNALKRYELEGYSWRSVMCSLFSQMRMIDKC